VAICVSALGSCVLLYRFINKNSRADKLEKRLKQLMDRYFANVKPEGTAISPKILAKNTTRDFEAAALVIACKRPTVKCCLDFLLQHRPSAQLSPIIVSQDCGHQPTADVIRSYGTQVSFLQQPDLSDVQGVRENMRSMMGHYRISRHYKWALEQAFDRMGYDTVLIIEDVLDIGKCSVAYTFFFFFCLREHQLISTKANQTPRSVCPIDQTDNRLSQFQSV